VQVLYTPDKGKYWLKGKGVMATGCLKEAHSKPLV